MALKIDIIYSVLEKLQKINDDSSFTEELIAYTLDTARAEIINTYLKRPDFITRQYIQSLDEVAVSLDDDSLTTTATDTTLLASGVIPIPLNVRGKDYLTRVGTLSLQSPPYNYVGYDRFLYSGNGKYSSRQIYATYYDNRIFIKGSKNITEFILVDTINVEGIFAQPDEVVKYNNSDSDLNWNYEYPLPENFVSLLESKTIELISPKLELQEDKINDAQE